jgi:hypothetical protein
VTVSSFSIVDLSSAAGRGVCREGNSGVSVP